MIESLYCLFTEHGRVHQALYCTAANCQGKHKFLPSVCSLTLHPDHHSSGTVAVGALGVTCCVSLGFFCFWLLSGLVVGEGVAKLISSHVLDL